MTFGGLILILTIVSRPVYSDFDSHSCIRHVLKDNRPKSDFCRVRIAFGADYEDAARNAFLDLSRKMGLPPPMSVTNVSAIGGDDRCSIVFLFADKQDWATYFRQVCRVVQWTPNNPATLRPAPY